MVKLRSGRSERIATLGSLLEETKLVNSKFVSSHLVLHQITYLTHDLQYLLSEALAQGADTLVSIGGVQSNHTRQVAAVAAKYGLKVCRTQGRKEHAACSYYLISATVSSSSREMGGLGRSCIR